MESGNVRLVKKVSVQIIFAAVSFLAALIFFALAAHEAFLHDEARFDQLIFDFFEKNVPEGLYPLVRVFTFFGKPDFLLPFYVFLVFYFILTKRKKYAIEFGVLGATSTGLLFGLKAVFQRNRPQIPIFEHLPGYSFPSGHALLSFILCSFLIYWLWNTKTRLVWKWVFTFLLVLFSLCQGISRIVLRVHYATDVIAGFCLAFTWVLIGLWAKRKWEKRRGNKNEMK